MERLHAAVENLARQFDNLTADVQSNIDRTAVASREQALASLERSQKSGVLAQAENTQQDLRTALENHRRFTQQLEQLEQIYLISEDLKNVVRDLEKKQKH